MPPLSSEFERSGWLVTRWCFPELSELSQSWACFSVREKKMFMQPLLALFVQENVNCFIADTGNSLR